MISRRRIQSEGRYEVPPLLSPQGCIDMNSFGDMRAEAASLVARVPGGTEVLPWRYGALPVREDLVENPSRIVTQNLQYLEDVEGRVFLDIGSGLGRDTLFLLRRGAEVYSVDKAGEALDFQRKWASRLNLPGRLHAINARLQDFRQDIAFDGVVSNISLWAALDRTETLDFIHYIQDHTKIGGVHLISALTPKNRENPCFRHARIFLTTPGQLKAWYFGGVLGHIGLAGRPHGVWEDINTREDTYYIDSNYPIPPKPDEPKRHTINLSARKTA